MTSRKVSKSIAISLEILHKIETSINSGKIGNLDEFVEMALRRELEARRQTEIDAELAEMAKDPDYIQEVTQLESEFAKADWEAFEIGVN
ncbi:hypothetical protein [Baaleninema sp.]|uniref:hypothetical protein n=1 Tax=Baaleninema sp. TaxID=3101197 RepID=UPI003D05B140